IAPPSQAARLAARAPARSEAASQNDNIMPTRRACSAAARASASTAATRFSASGREACAGGDDDGEILPLVGAQGGLGAAKARQQPRGHGAVAVVVACDAGVGL